MHRTEQPALLVSHRNWDIALEFVAKAFAAVSAFPARACSGVVLLIPATAVDSAVASSVEFGCHFVLPVHYIVYRYI